jgi:diamine N-acetyltransferase
MTEQSPGANVSLRKVTGKTVRAICDLNVSESQKGLVSPNAVSIAEAYFTKYAWFRAIYAGNIPVGFVMLHEDPKRGAYGLWRFMIDARYQGRGYGRKALDLVIERVKKRPKAKSLTLHVVRAERGAEELYKRYGFEFTGKIEEGQHVMRLRL